MFLVFLVLHRNSQKTQNFVIICHAPIFLIHEPEGLRAFDKLCPVSRIELPPIEKEHIKQLTYRAERRKFTKSGIRRSLQSVESFCSETHLNVGLAYKVQCAGPLHTGLIVSISIQITALTACITLKNQPLWLQKVIFSFLCMSNQ